MKRYRPSLLVFGLFTIILFAGAFWVALPDAGQSAFASQQQQRLRQQPPQQRTTWEYARLLVNDGNTAWHAGENGLIIDVVPLEVQYQRLGGVQPANLTNLLNVIGRDGWELVATDESVWTFKRPAR